MEIKYFDNAATTRVKEEVLKEMIPYFTEEYGNPSSIYSIGRRNKRAIEEAREKVAKLINAKIHEIYFTAGGSESDNLALKGFVYANREKGNHIITTKIEHHAILETCENLEKHGFKVTYLNVDKDGIIKLEELINSITDKTILISIMFANNEIGTIQPIEEISKIAKHKNIVFHTDAVQACRECSNRCSKIRNRYVIFVRTQIIWTKRNRSIIYKKWNKSREIYKWRTSREKYKSWNRKCSRNSRTRKSM